MSSRPEAADDPHALLRESVRRFARERLWPNAARWDRERHFPREELREAAAMGLFGVAIPERWDGAGMDATSLAIACEEVSAGDGATGTILAVNNLVAGILNGFGSDGELGVGGAGTSGGGGTLSGGG